VNKTKICDLKVSLRPLSKDNSRIRPGPLFIGKRTRTRRNASRDVQQYAHNGFLSSFFHTDARLWIWFLPYNRCVHVSCEDCVCVCVCVYTSRGNYQHLPNYKTMLCTWYIIIICIRDRGKVFLIHVMKTERKIKKCRPLAGVATTIYVARTNLTCTPFLSFEVELVSCCTDDVIRKYLSRGIGTTASLYFYFFRFCSGQEDTTAPVKIVYPHHNRILCCNFQRIQLYRDRLYKAGETIASI